MLQLMRNLAIAALVLPCIFLGLLVIVNAIPTAWVHSSLPATVTTLKKEGTYPSVGFAWRKIVLDNFTDGVMLNIAYSVDSSNPLKASIRNVQHDGDTDMADQIATLEKMQLGTGTHETIYERYWHGYLIFLRPLLAVTSYSGVRVVLTFLLFGTLAAFLYLSWKKLGVRSTFGLIIGFLAVDILWLGSSMQLSNVFITGMLGSIYLLTRKKLTFAQIATTFFVVGAVISYIDVLSAPVVGLGLLLVTAIGLQKNIDLKKVIVLCVLWSIGYLGLWGAKWVLGEFTYTPGAIAGGYRKVQDRTMNSVDAEFSRTNAMLRNLYQLRGYDKRDKILLLVLGICYIAFLARYFSPESASRQKIITWSAIALIPYLWYFLAAEHSYIHVLFTYRDQFITVVAVFLATTEFVNQEKLHKDLAPLKRLTNSVTRR